MLHTWKQPWLSSILDWNDQKKLAKHPCRCVWVCEKIFKTQKYAFHSHIAMHIPQADILPLSNNKENLWMFTFWSWNLYWVLCLEGNLRMKIRARVDSERSWDLWPWSSLSPYFLSSPSSLINPPDWKVPFIKLH